MMKIEQFIKHMNLTVNDLLDDLDAGKDLDKYDLTITWGGKSLQIPMHADLYSELEALLKRELEGE